MRKTETVQRIYDEQGNLTSEVTTTTMTEIPVTEDPTLKIGMYL